jgi:hypothetical protein
MVTITVFWDVAPCSLVEVRWCFRGDYYLHHHGDDDLMMEAISTSETSADFYQTTRHNIPDDSNLYSSRRENLKSHQNQLFWIFSNKNFNAG